MQKSYSWFAILFILITSVSTRLCFSEIGIQPRVVNVINYDAFGYYWFLPAIFIYEDVKELQWLPEKEKQYTLSGDGKLYQFVTLPQGGYTGKYLCGVAILQAPFCALGHCYAKINNYPSDGFSPPYHWALVAASIFYGILGLVLIRKLLSPDFSDTTIAMVLLLMSIGSNWLQYIAIENAMSHAYIFPLYAAVLLATKKWHETPTLSLAFGIGLIIGIATISRPTEIIMLFIPLLWDTFDSASRQKKSTLLQKKPLLIASILLGGVIGILPQLVYWKYSTGSWIFSVGSKWFFLNPFFRVLFGTELGWFIYTPISILFIISLLYLKKHRTQNALWVFIFLNIWIVIAWSDWKYGATFSCRALVQSYPVFAIPLALLLSQWKESKYKIVLPFLYLLIPINLYLVWKYNTTGL